MLGLFTAAGMSLPLARKYYVQTPTSVTISIPTVVYASMSHGFILRPPIPTQHSPGSLQPFILPCCDFLLKQFRHLAPTGLNIYLDTCLFSVLILLICSVKLISQALQPHPSHLLTINPSTRRLSTASVRP